MQSVLNGVASLYGSLRSLATPTSLTGARSTLADSDLQSLPAARALRNGRCVEDGYARGWGLQYGGLDRKVAADPVYRRAVRISQRRSVIAEPNRMNLYLLMRFFLPRLPPGDIIEFGSYRGGTAIFMAAVAKLLDQPCRVFALDTFEGMPATDRAVDAHGQGDFSTTDLEEIEAHAARMGLDNLQFVKGLFQDTTANVLAQTHGIALAHIDCDIHSAVCYAYDAVKPRMLPMGYIVFDDATTSSCIGATEAVEDLVVRRDGMSSEQVYPQLVFRARG